MLSVRRDSRQQLTIPFLRLIAVSESWMSELSTYPGCGASLSFVAVYASNSLNHTDDTGYQVAPAAIREPILDRIAAAISVREELTPDI